MQSSNPYPEPGLNPAGPFEQLAGWLAGATIQVLLGLVIGMIAARLMRGRHLHWSWAAGALAIVLLSRPVFAEFDPDIGSSCAWRCDEGSALTP